MTTLVLIVVVFCLAWSNGANDNFTGVAALLLAKGGAVLAAVLYRSMT